MTSLRFVARGSALVGLGALLACGGASEPVGSSTPTPSGSSSSTGSSGTTPASACAEGAVDVAVSSDDLNGFPPYAVDGCTLAYVNGAGELVLRDLATRAEEILARRDERPRRPSISSAVVVWEAEERGARVVRVLPLAPRGAAYTITGSFAMAGEPRAAADAVVLTAWASASERSDADVWLHVLATRETTRVIGGPGQQRFAAASARAIVASDFSEDADGTYDGNGTDLADLVVLDRTTGQVTKRPAPGKQAFPMLGDDDLLAYLEWSTVHPEPKLVAYDLKVGPLFGQPAQDRLVANVTYMSSDYARPAVSGRMLEWVANPDGRTALYRAPLDGASPPREVSGLSGLQLYAPAPSTGFTVLAASPSAALGASPRLRAVQR